MLGEGLDGVVDLFLWPGHYLLTCWNNKICVCLKLFISQVFTMFLTFSDTSLIRAGVAGGRTSCSAQRYLSMLKGWGSWHLPCN